MGRSVCRVLVAGTLFALALSAAADTVNYTGTATTVISKMSLPLGHGASVISAASAGVAAISTTPPSLLEMNCLGFGAQGDDEVFSAEFYCTLKATADDVLDLKGVDGAEGGKVTVIGGSGKWRGASGSGTFKRISASDTDATSTFELSVTTP